MIPAPEALAAPSRRQPSFRVQRPQPRLAGERSAPRRAGRRPGAVRHHPRLLRLARAGRDRLRPGARRPVRHPRRRQHRRAVAGRQRRVRGGALRHAARRRARALAVRRDPGDARGAEAADRQPVAQPALDRRPRPARRSSRCSRRSCATIPTRSSRDAVRANVRASADHLRHGSDVLEQLIRERRAGRGRRRVLARNRRRRLLRRRARVIRDIDSQSPEVRYAQRRPGDSALCACPPRLLAQNTQTFEIDPFWPKPLPDKWIIGRTGSICADAHDHLVVTNRRDITDEEAETSIQAPSVLIFDLAGNLVHSFGDSNTVPGVIHGCFVDHENNIWLTGNGDGIVQKWTHDGKLLLQIGKRGVFDTTDGTAKGAAAQRQPHAILQPCRRRRRSGERRRVRRRRIRQPARGGVRPHRHTSCVSGAGRPRRRKSRRARAARSRRLCTASR